MKFLPSLLICAMLTGVTNLQAQNRVMILQPGDSIGNKLKLPKDRDGMSYISDFQYNIPKPATIITSNIPLTCNWVDAAQESVNRFQSTHLSNGYVDLGRDFLDGGYAWYHDMDFDGAPWRKMEKKDSIMKSNLLKTLCTNKIVQEAVYQWLLPAYLDAYSVMSVPEQKAYIKMFEDGIVFADSFNVEREERVVADAENYSNVVGSLNAFIYRRVTNKDLSRQDCVKWMKRIVADLKANEKQNPQAADELVLTSTIGYDYYSATDFINANGYEAEFRILKRKDEGYEILPIPLFKVGNYGVPESNFFTCFSYENGYMRYLFYCDDTGWSFTKTAYEENDKAHTFMGSGKSARVLMIYYYDFDYTETGEEYDNVDLTMAAVVDLDSGFIVHDSVGVPEYTYYDDMDYSRNEYPTLNKDRTVFYCYTTNSYGVMDRLGNILLPPNYKSVELTDDPEIVKVNGKKLVSVRGGGKPPKKKK